MIRVALRRCTVIPRTGACATAQGWLGRAPRAAGGSRRSLSLSRPSRAPNPSSGGKKPGLKDLIKSYGPVGAVWWSFLYVGGWGGCYVVLALNPELMAQATDFVQRQESLPASFRDALSSKWAPLVVAFAINEIVLEWGRFPLVLATTPRLARALGRGPKP